MEILHTLILGLVQGLTEFIPVSSSGHLVLLHRALGISETGLGFDVALHIGTLAALGLFFYKDLLRLVREGIKGGPERHLAVVLGLATVPAVVAGAWLQSEAETSLRSSVVVCASLAGVALLMLLAERLARRRETHSLENVSIKQGVLIGAAQAAALIPGISRSGSTITAGLFLGLDRVAATRFSFLLSIPITLGAIIKVLLDGEMVQRVTDNPSIFIIGIITAFLSGSFAIRFLLKFVARHGLNTFAYYRLVLAAVSLLLILVF